MATGGATPLSKAVLSLRGEHNKDKDATSLPGTFPQFFEDLPVFPQMPDFSTHPASDAFGKSMMSTVNKEHIKEMTAMQGHMLARFEKTNEMLLNFNALSAARYQSTQAEFVKHTALLAEMKADLDDIFKRIRNMKMKIRSRYPKAFASCAVKYEVPDEAEEDDGANRPRSSSLGHTPAAHVTPAAAHVTELPDVLIPPDDAAGRRERRIKKAFTVHESVTQSADQPPQIDTVTEECDVIADDTATEAAAQPDTGIGGDTQAGSTDVTGQQPQVNTAGSEPPLRAGGNTHVT